MRISGLASGMDTETMVKELMTAHRIPLDKIIQKKQYTEWQRDDYRTVNRSLNDFRNLTNDSMLRQSTFIKKTVTSSAPDDVSVKNINSTSDFSGKIKVNQLAESATMQSTSSVLASEANLKDKLLNTGGNFTITAINADGKLDAGYEVEITPESTMQSVLDDINKNSGVNAFYDSFTGKIAFTAKYSGDAKDEAEIQFSGNSGNANSYAFLKVATDNITATTTPTDSKDSAGNIINWNCRKKCKIHLNGLTTERQSNTFQISGFEISLKQANQKEITFSSAPDVDSILGSVTKFVDEYNKLIEDLNTQIRETKYKDYQPLTEKKKNHYQKTRLKNGTKKRRVEH